MFMNIFFRPDLPFGFWFIGNNLPNSPEVTHRAARSFRKSASEEAALQSELLQTLGLMV